MQAREAGSYVVVEREVRRGGPRPRRWPPRSARRGRRRGRPWPLTMAAAMTPWTASSCTLPRPARRASTARAALRSASRQRCGSRRSPNRAPAARVAFGAEELVRAQQGEIDVEQDGAGRARAGRARAGCARLRLAHAWSDRAVSVRVGPDQPGSWWARGGPGSELGKRRRGAIRGAHERPRHDAHAQALAQRHESGELVGRHVARHRQAAGGRAQVLPHGDQVGAGRGAVGQHAGDLVAALAQAEHEARLDERRRAGARAPRRGAQQGQRALIRSPRPHLAVEARHGLEVVVEHLGARREHGLQGAGPVAKVGYQHLDARLRQRLRGAPSSWPRSGPRRRRAGRRA